MKKTLFIILLMCVSLLATAQSWVEVVYLKNGGRVRGIVIEQVPGESLKVQTADGSIFVYQMSEVEKITKEEVSPASHSYTPYSQSANNYQRKAPVSIVKKPYTGREKEGKFSLNVGIGISPNSVFQVNDFSHITAKYSAYGVNVSNQAGFSLNAGVSYSRFFDKGSPWFWDAGLLVDMDRIGIKVRWTGGRLFDMSCFFWNYSAQAGVGMQTSPNQEGFHFYWKAGVGVSYMTLGAASVLGYGPASEVRYYDEDVMALVDNGYTWEEYKAAMRGIHPRPYAEIGFGNDDFLRFGIRYSPLISIMNSGMIHAITISASIPIL